MMNEDLRETLLILMEECAEVSQAISKCFRFGPDQLKPGKERTNINMLEEELSDGAVYAGRQAFPRFKG